MVSCVACEQREGIMNNSQPLDSTGGNQDTCTPCPAPSPHHSGQDDIIQILVASVPVDTEPSQASPSQENTDPPVSRSNPGPPPHPASCNVASRIASTLVSKTVLPFQALVKLYCIFVNRWWLFEISSLVVSILSMMAVLIVLLKTDGTALADWAFLIQPNSLVSVFMTVSKATMIMPIAECISQAKWMAFHQSAGPLTKLQTFDEASRGPWGSTRLLLSPKTAGLIGWLGALLTVVSLALDPFTQQVITFPTRRVPAPAEAAHVQVIHSLDAVDLVPMQGAILSSLYVEQAGPRITYNCTTSQCQWLYAVTSLGICADCRNITSLTTRTCATVPGPLHPSANETWTFSTTSCNYTINANITLKAFIQTLSLPAADGRPAEHASQFTQFKVRDQEIKFGLGDFLAHNVTWISTVLTFTTAFDSTHRRLPQLTMQDLSPSIFACGFYFCAQAYTDLAVTNGTLQHTAPSISLPLGNVRDAAGQPLLQPSAATGWSEMLAPVGPTTSFPGNTTFAIGQQVLNSLRGYLHRQIFNATQNGGNDDFRVFPDDNVGLDSLRSVSAFVDIAATFDRIAAAMSHQVRLSNGSRLAVGDALVDATYVAVRWAWLALPLAVLGLVGVLLVVTILGNGKRKTRIWKSSSIAMLVHPLHGWGEDELRFRSLAEMESFADGVRVRLEDGGGTGGFRWTWIRRNKWGVYM
ncbi:hypothetical protein B0T22DRAFT_540208 [Podospora appendiculata]|uniref:Uncharacterized protein n=1 Tax=Podospora appendiculata TaxID=314037 RepID=A0AAE1C7D3_9PEZI|nr:hypothetical protein B0T22DRAFT_540208 [Podospora appendiculata]